MSTTVELLSQSQATAMLEDLRRCATPGWLEAAIQIERIQTALRQQVPEFASGGLMLRDCEIKRLRLRDESGYWTGMYQLTVEGLLTGQRRVVPMYGTLIPPGLARPGGDNGQPTTHSTLSSVAGQAANQKLTLWDEESSMLAAAHSDPPAFGAEGWRCYLPELCLELQTQPPDTELPALPVLTDPEQARVLLERSIRAGRPKYRDFHLQACTPQVMRYKPGSRCTVLYHLEYPVELAPTYDWPKVVVAKTYHGDKGQNAYEAMEALWNSPLAASSAVTIAEPLAYLPELNVLLQGPIREETTLKELIRSALHSGTPEAMRELCHYMSKTAVGLAELHQCGVSYGEIVTWENELAEIRQRHARLAIPIPQLGGTVTSLLAHLERLVALYPPDPPRPAHRSFRPAQVLLCQGEIGFIDFDGFCQAEPAMDLALFMTKVKHIALTKPGEDEDMAAMEDPEARQARLSQIEALCDLFLSEYEARQPISRQRVALWEALDLLTLLLGCWVKVKTARLNNTLFLLERHLQKSGLYSK